MAQKRFHNYARNLVSFDENQRFIGLVIPGVYSGWDGFTILSGSSLRMNHNVTGIRPVASDNSTEQNRHGVVVSRQGFFIYEDDTIDVVVDTNGGNAFTRIDYLVMQHQYLSSAGGQVATYSIIKGANGGPVEPSLSVPLHQVLIGKFYIPANATDHTATAFIKNSMPSLGGYGFRKISETDIEEVPTNPVVNDFNAQVKSGFYSLNNPSNSPIATPRWSLLVLRRGTYITQLAAQQDNGKLYSRASVNSGSSWQPWVNMNNPDTVIDFTPINNQIGSRTYTEDNYVTDGQTLTASIDALDIALKDRADDITTANTNISNLNSAIGNRVYDLQKILTNGESITASLNKLDKMVFYDEVDTKANLDAIPTAFRKWGMVVTVFNDGDNTGKWQLIRGLSDTNKATNANWFQIESDWITTGLSYNTNWAGSTANYEFAMRKFNGRVMLRGIIAKNPGTATAGETMVTLPAGWRPLGSRVPRLLVAPQSTTGATNWIDINSSGVMTLWEMGKSGGANLSNNGVHLDNVSFPIL